MKSLLKSNISWFGLLYLFVFLLPFAMEENIKKINSYSVNQLQNDFIGLKKNPQKYVKFQLNAENTTYSDAGGLYELLPYYQKINPLGEKVNYVIQWCDFVEKWQLIKVNPLGDFPRFNVEQTTIATLLEGDQFSRPTNADIKAYKTYEQMKSAIKMVGEKNKELKMKIIEMQEANDEITSLRETREKLEKTLAKIKEQNKKLKAYALEQNNIAKKENEKNKIQAEENQKILKELESLTSNLKEEKIQIEKKNEEKRALEYQIGDLAYKLDHAKEYEQKYLSLGKEVNPLKVQIKYLQTHTKESVKQWDIRNNQMEIIFNKHDSDISELNEELKNANNEKEVCNDTFKKFERRKQEEINETKKYWQGEVEEAKLMIKIEMQKNDIKIKEIQEIYDVKIKEIQEIYETEIKTLKRDIERQKETEFINFQENLLMNNFHFQSDGFVSDLQEIEFKNGDNASNCPIQTHNY